jgi:tricorn protease
MNLTDDRQAADLSGDTPGQRKVELPPLRWPPSASGRGARKQSSSGFGRSKAAAALPASLQWSGVACLALFWMVTSRGAEPNDWVPEGYYRYPAVHDDTIVFTAEGDLWRVSTHGGVAQRLTSHPGEESHPAISPDGKTLAFSAEYEGPTEVYTMSLDGSPPARRTYEGSAAIVVGWTPEGKVLYGTRTFSTLPNWQLATLELKRGMTELVPLSQASDGVFEPDGKVLFFTRQAFQGSSTKRYQGGTAQNLWRFALDAAEATPLTADFPGTSKSPMWWDGRVYFITDRDGTMNIWSMDPDGHDLRQHTTHRGWDVKGASLSAGRIVYQLGADLRLFEIASRKDSVIPITLPSDFDQEREKWIKTPSEYLTSVHLSSNGDRLALTARGQVFVAWAKQGRFVEVTRQQPARYRAARFMPDGKSLVGLSDQTGELEFEKLPANGVGEPEALTHDGKVFRFDGVPSPDAKWLAYQDKNQKLWLFDLEHKVNLVLATNNVGGFWDLQWSPDSQWLAYVAAADNEYSQILLYQLTNGTTTALTSERVNSFSPAWSTDGKWLYFLSDRRLESAVPSPWGPRAPEPFFYEPIKIYLVSLQRDGRSPFDPDDELHPKAEEKSDKDEHKKDSDSTRKPEEAKEKEGAAEKKATSKPAETNKPPLVTIDLAGIQSRVQAVPVPAGDYSELSLNSEHLFWVAHAIGSSAKSNLMTLKISNEEPKPKVLVEDLQGYELSADTKKLLIRQKGDFYVVDSSEGAPIKLEKSVDLKNWTFSVNPHLERRQMFLEAWRLMRDFFYDPAMHGTDWPAIRDKYLPLVERVRDRAELSDLVADMVGELSALHIFVVGGDFREGPDQVRPAGLGAVLKRDESGYRIEHIYASDPDYPERLSPLAKPGLDVKEGDIIQAVNGVSLASGTHPSALLRNQAGRQVLLTLLTPGAAKPREAIVTAIGLDRERELRYDDWEYSRRKLVEDLGKSDIGYVHLRAMGASDIAQWARDFYPVFNRKGLVVDVRHNGGGNVDSWVLEKLMRKAWFYWQPRVGHPTWNMQYAFRGHVVVLCDERTGSDGEAFTEGFKRLGLGKVIGTRTWGGEIWLSFDNWLVDKGIASAAEYGVYGPEGKWLIEGHGVDPDLVVDNLPHASFQGEDAQLKAALKELEERIRLEPVTNYPAPPHPTKAFK